MRFEVQKLERVSWLVGQEVTLVKARSLAASQRPMIKRDRARTLGKEFRIVTAIFRRAPPEI